MKTMTGIGFFFFLTKCLQRHLSKLFPFFSYYFLVPMPPRTHTKLLKQEREHSAPFTSFTLTLLLPWRQRRDPKGAAGDPWSLVGDRHNALTLHTTPPSPYPSPHPPHHTFPSLHLPRPSFTAWDALQTASHRLTISSHFAHKYHTHSLILYTIILY